MTTMTINGTLQGGIHALDMYLPTGDQILIAARRLDGDRTDVSQLWISAFDIHESGEFCRIMRITQGEARWADDDTENVERDAPEFAAACEAFLSATDAERAAWAQTARAMLAE